MYRINGLYFTLLVELVRYKWDFLRRAIFLQYLAIAMPLQVVKTGGHEKKTVLVNLTFSIFCGKPNLFLRNQHRLCIAPFIRKPWVRNSDPCFSLS